MKFRGNGLCAQNQIALSSMDRFVPHAGISGKEIIVGIKAYLDRSGTRPSAYVTLAAFAGPDETWAEFESGWNEVLKTGFMPVPYFHVIEALGCRYKTPFCYTLGWERGHAWELMGKLLVYISQFNRGRLTMHSCIVDMNAWRELIASGISIPSEIDLCNKYVSKYIVGMFANKIIQEQSGSPEIYLRAEDLLSFAFDRSEQFFEPFRDFVNGEKDEAERAGVNSMWQFVDGVGEGEMRFTPGIQAADILAWVTNRENISAEGGQGKFMAHILRQVVMFTSKEYDREALLQEFGPPLPNVYL